MNLSVSDLPLVNASLNGLATILLVIGYVCIRQRRIAAHRAVMVAAFATSVLFLISYLVYHAHAGSRPFPGRGTIRVIYFTILITHVVLAATIPPLAGITLWRAYHGQFDRHVRIARWTLPLWLYVSITGIVVYLDALPDVLRTGGGSDDMQVRRESGALARMAMMVTTVALSIAATRRVRRWHLRCRRFRR